MCGRIVLARDWKNIAAEFALADAPQFPAPAGDIYPGRVAAGIVRGRENNTGVNLRWGFSLRWSGEKCRSSLLINARAETISRKPLFRDAFQKRRCLIVADGFYEWSKEKKQLLFCLQDKKTFGLAGIYDPEISAGGPASSFVIITTRANELIAPFHDRMPVIISADEQTCWLDNSRFDVCKLTALLKPYPAEEMAMCKAGSDALHI